MADQGGLSAKIGADVSDFLKAFTQMQSVQAKTADGFKELGSSAKEAASSLNDLTPASTAATNAIGKVFTALKNGEKVTLSFVDGVNKGKQGLGDLPDKFDKLKKPVGDASYALTNVGRVAQDLPFGFIAIQNNLPPLVDSFGSLIKQSGGVAGAFKAIGSSLLGFGGLGLLFNVVVSGLTMYSMSARKGKDDTDKLKDSQKSLKDIMQEGITSVSGQTQEVKALIAVLTDSNTSYERRKSVLNELKKIGGDYFRDLTLEKSSYEQLKEASDKYINSLIRQAQIKGLRDQITQLTEQVAKTTPILSAETKKLMSGPNPFAALSDTVKKAKDDTTINLANFKGALKSNSAQIVGDVAKVGTSISAAVGKFTIGEDLKKKLEEATAALSNLVGDTDTPDKGNKTRTVNDVLMDMDVLLKNVDYQAELLGASFDQISGDKISILKDAFSDLVKLGLTPTDERLKSIAGEIDKLSLANIGTQTIGARIQLSPKEFKANEKAFGKMGFDTSLQNVDAAQKALNDKIASVGATTYQKVADMTNDLVKQINDLISSTVSEGIVSIGESIGNALVSGNWGGVLGSFADTIAGFLEQLGKLLIAQGIAMEAFVKSLDSMNGIVSIVAGLALVGAAGAFKAATKKGIPAFANGAITSGPMMAMVGDNPSGKEAIIPLERFDEIFGSMGGSKVHLTGQLRASGPDLIYVFDNAQQQQGRKS
ncbi:hypothetical protein ACE38W_14500 [Chitinophaga sp. Hz27]|uniref:hypothetical protein n=1 Tax=Chitinophaga sp. Hz27 TaxID=3347169 RepID=UPI0035DD7251